MTTAAEVLEYMEKNQVSMKDAMKALKPPEPEQVVLQTNEIRRKYDFGNGRIVALNNVTEVMIRKSGTHRLKTADGLMHIVPTGWIHIEIQSPDSWVDVGERK